ncbi:MAG: cyclic pyranopterin monophosphate synthase MoaC [Fusobacteriales bacterium]|jgi:cyclic pyranopterin phosphate synthase|nr:cyclic pyranopterin monophosphate synthase MoaC [Fusobacteriales bacterium]
MSNELSHFDKDGKAIMVDISGKNETERTAVATGEIRMTPDTLRTIKEGNIKKGDVLGVARVAAIMASKNTCNAIPMCHNILLSSAKIEFETDDKNSLIKIKSTVKTTGKTGVEMEALMMVSVAGLTIYDMCKAIDKEMIIGEIKLEEKLGGKSGVWKREEK